jgi:hypothetical protein
MADQERNLSDIADGAMATQLFHALQDVVDDQQRICAQSLVAMYRQGGIDHDMMVGKVAEMAALQTLMSNLEAKQQRGYVAAQKEFGDGEEAAAQFPDEYR